ncbi:hypothetical protein ASE74_20665 [Pedobacter sp. Leaf216]|nr:hypothetical protein ASE74_20665 [Pedobacter sp. Leaf216]
MLLTIIHRLSIIQLFGFGSWSVCYFFFLQRKLFKEVDIVVTRITRVAGIIYTMTFIVWFFEAYFGSDSYTFTIENQMFGSYAFTFWFQFLFLFLVTQILWIKTCRQSRYFRLIIGILLLWILEAERLTVLITSFHRDYMAFDSLSLLYPLILGYFMKLILFLIFNGLFYWILLKIINTGKLNNHNILK